MFESLVGVSVLRCCLIGFWYEWRLGVGWAERDWKWSGHGVISCIYFETQLKKGKRRKNDE